MSSPQSQLDRLSRYLEQDKDNVTLICDVLSLQLRLGEFDAAWHLAQDSLERLPGDPKLLFNTANVAIARREPERAAAYLDELLAQGYDNLGVRYNRGYCALLAGDYQDCQDRLAPLAEHWQEYPPVLMSLARAQHHLGLYEEASKNLGLYLDQKTDDGEALGALALLHLDAGEPASAAECAQRALAADARNLEALLTLGTLGVNAQDVEQAAPYLERAITAYPESGRSWSEWGQLHLLNLDFDQALEALSKAVRFMPEHIGTWHALAWCQLALGQVPEAKSSLEKALDLNRNFSETHGGLAVVAIAENDEDEARSAIKRALRLDPNSISGRYAESLLLQKHGEAAKAQDIVKRLLSGDTGIPGQSFQSLMQRVVERKRAQTLRDLKH